MLLSEKWKDIKDYENYEVSNLGRVKNKKTGRILKPEKTRDGYMRVSLCKDGIQRHALLHRLVSLTFLPNSQNLPQVNHKDEDKTNNCLDNLEWCDHKYNNNYGTKNERQAEKMSKPVLQFDLLGNFIKEWPSMMKVYEELGIHQGNISSCCSGNRKSAGGYLWKYKN